MKRAETDLHLHLDGSLSAQVVKTLADQIGYDLKGREIKDIISVKEDCESLQDYLTCFELPGILLQTAEGLYLATFDLVKRLDAEGLIYAEIRFAPQLHRRQGLTQEQAVEAVIKGVKNACKQCKIVVGILLCAMVNGADADNEETMELSKAYLGRGVVGADIAGPEGLVPMAHFETMFQRAYQAGVPFTIHAGECGDYENIARAVSYGARRIGHGCAAIQSHTCMELLKREKITLEMCVTSNLQTKAVANLAEHPLKQFYDRGLRVTYNTDNMTVSDTTLEKERRLLICGMGFTEEELTQMNRYAVESAFMGDSEKALLLEKL